MKVGAEFWTAHVVAAQPEMISASEYARWHGLSVAALYLLLAAQSETKCWGG